MFWGWKVLKGELTLRWNSGPFFTGVRARFNGFTSVSGHSMPNLSAVDRLININLDFYVNSRQIHARYHDFLDLPIQWFGAILKCTFVTNIHRVYIELLNDISNILISKEIK